MATLQLANLHMSFTFYVITQQAAARTAGQWKTWYWICFGGIIFFLLSIPLLRGRWKPADARRDEHEHEHEHEAMVAAELTKLAS